MIIINKNTNNEFQITSDNNLTLTNPYFLFEFVSEVSNESVCFIAENTSTQTQRYYEFTVTETTGTNILTSGTITLNPQGLWKYRIFEQSSSTNLNPSLATNTTPIKKGIVRVKGDSTVDWTFNEGSIDTYEVNE